MRLSRIIDNIERREKGLTTKSYDDIIDDAMVWQKKTFPDATPEGMFNHLFKEVDKELRAKKDDPLEFADVILLAIGMANIQGIDIRQALKTKMDMNKIRTWGKKNDQGFYEHV